MIFLLLLFAVPALAQVQFTDQTAAAGLTLKNTFGGLEKKYIVEAHGSGAGFFDYDSDGDLDLYVVNGATFETYKQKSGPGDVLYRNEGEGKFADVTAAAGVGDPGWGTGCAAGDIDNDGDADLLVTNYGSNTLYSNGAKVNLPTSPPTPGWPATNSAPVPPSSTTTTTAIWTFTWPTT